MNRSVCVVGAGVVGSATAYVFARAGYEVVLVEALAAPAQVTSLANGAQLSYSYVEPLASPGTLRKLPSLLIERNSPLRVRLTRDWSQYLWMLQFVRACTRRQARRSTRALLELASLSRQELHDACQLDALEFDHATVGKLVVCESPSAFAAARQQVDYQRQLGCEQSVLSADECIEREPALMAYRDHVAGAVWTPGEAVGDANKLSCELVDRVRRMGGDIRYRTRIAGFRRQGRRVVGLTTDAGEEIPIPGGVVIANGADAPATASALGLHLPIYPIKGYSITLPITDPMQAPSVSVTDLRRKTVYAPLPGRLRVAGMAEIVGHDLRVDRSRIRHLVDCARETFPGSCDFNADPQAWAGLRPSTPSALPIIGGTAHENVLLNVGHGALGLTLAMGSARLLERQHSDPAADRSLAEMFAYSA